MTSKAKAIYAKYGITTDGDKLVTPFEFGGKKIKTTPILKNGNSKVGKGVYTFSTLPTNRLFRTAFCPFCDCFRTINISAAL